MSFRNLGLDAKILHAVQEAGYTEPTPIQTAAIPPLLAGHDLIGIAQTGTGKTAAFTLPMLTRLAAPPAPGQRRGTRVLVLAPTRELVLQIEENVRAYAKYLPLTVATVFGGVGEQPQIRALRAAHGHRHRLPGTAAGPDGPALRRFFRDCNSWCSTKPTGCWTWVFCRTSGASSSNCRSSGRR